MIFAEALGEDDEYVRLLKISLGIKEVSFNLRNMQIITDHNILKSMICSYPFQKASIGLLMSAFFDYFKHRLFLQAFYKALQEVSELQEYREFLGNRNSRNLKMTINGNVNKIIGEQQKQGSIPFSKQVIEKLIIAKRFACSYLKRFFQLAIELNIDLEEMSIIFKQFIINTRCHKFQQQLIDQFFDCKQSIFYNFSWKNKQDQELDDFCNKWTIEIAPQWILDRKQSMSSFNYIGTEKQIKTEQDDEYLTPASKVESVADYVEIMQKMICKPIEMVNQHDLLQLHNNDNIEILIKFIINPLKTELIDDWGLLFQRKDIENEDYKNIFKSTTIHMDYLNTIRSYKSLQFLTQKVNHSRYYLTIQEMMPKIFEQILESLNNESIQLNLNHLAMLIDQLLIICPKVSILKIIELDFLFLFLQYSNNTYIESLITDILDITIDKYKFGYQIQEQIWTYIIETKWIDFINNNIFQQNLSKLTFPIIQQNQQKSKIINLLSKFKDVQKPIEIVRISILDEYIGHLGGSYNQQNADEHIQLPENLSYAQLLEQDIDAIKPFLDDRRLKNSRNQSRKQSRKTESQLISYQSTLISHNRNITLNIPSLPSINTIKSISTVFNDSKQKRGSVDKYENIDKTVNSKTSQFILSLLQNSRFSLSSDTGFSSSKLVMLYPSSNHKANPSQFELDQSKFQYNTTTFEYLINLLEKILNIILIYEMRKPNNQENQNFCKLFFNQELVFSLFKFYLYEINQKKESSFQCGRIINQIYYLAKRHGNIEQQLILKDIFFQVIEYMNKIIININKLNSDVNIIEQFIMFQTIKNGFDIYEPYDVTKLNKNIYKFLNETVIHLYIIYFFKSKQNTLYQYQFVEFINLIFEKAPAYLLQNILFNIGLISSLYNAYTTFYSNGFKSHSYNESLFYYIIKLIRLIHNNLIKRELNVILSSLQPLDSWKCLMKTIPNNQFIKDKKLKTQEVELQKSTLDSQRSIRQSILNESHTSMSQITNNRKNSQNQSTPQKFRARIQQFQQKSISGQSSSQLVY